MQITDNQHIGAKVLNPSCFEPYISGISKRKLNIINVRSKVRQAMFWPDQNGLPGHPDKADSPRST
jgi:hypothetical protein